MTIRFRLVLIASVLLLVAVTGLSTAQQSSDKLTASKVASLARMWEAALARGDAAGMAALYAEDAQLLPPNANTVSGRKNIEIFWRAAMDAGMKNAKVEPLEVESMGSTGSEVGKYTMFDGAGKVVDAGKYIVLWKYEKGQWKLHRDIWNSNNPPPSQ